MEAMRAPVPKKKPVLQSVKEEQEAPLASAGNLPVFPERTKRSFSIKDVFEVDLGVERNEKGEIIKDENGNEVTRDRNVDGYVSPTAHTPKIDPYYVFPKEQTVAVLLGMACRDPILALGPTGGGKTSLIEQIAARLNYSLIKISFDSAISRNDLIGEWVVKGNEMVFQYGIVPISFRMPGTIILLDEWDAQNAETAYVLQRPLQKEDRKIFLLETLELIPMHPDNVICATANTNGQGDDTGLYSHGTRIQSYAQLNRFAVTIKMDYLPPEQEKKILSRMFEKNGLDKDEIDSLVQATNKVRDGFMNGQLSVPLSTRDLINWTSKYLNLADAMKAATFCFLNRMSIEDAKTAESIIQRAFEDN
jgi:cobaltochelatase CobS